MSAVGAGENVNVYVPSILSTAVGPAAGSQPQNGPVILTSDPPVFPHTSVVITKSCEKELSENIKQRNKVIFSNLFERIFIIFWIKF